MENKEVTFRGKIINYLGLGVFGVDSFKRIRPNEKCWKCRISVLDLKDETISCAFSIYTGNKIICNKCCVDFMEQGIEVRVNKLPINDLRKIKIDKLL